MFKVVHEPTFRHTVTVQTPVDGGHKAETLKVTYLIIPTDAAAKFDTMTEQGSRDFARAIVVKLDDLVGEDGETPIPYSDDIRERLLRQPHVRSALIAGYTDALSKGRLGN